MSCASFFVCKKEYVILLGDRDVAWLGIGEFAAQSGRAERKVRASASPSAKYDCE